MLFGNSYFVPETSLDNVSPKYFMGLTRCGESHGGLVYGMIRKKYFIVMDNHILPVQYRVLMLGAVCILFTEEFVPVCLCAVGRLCKDSLDCSVMEVFTNVIID